MTKEKETKQSAPVLVQLGIFSGVLFVSSFLSSLFPKNFPVPTPVIGLVLLYLLLTTHIIKLEWVDSLSSFLISIIGFLFIPSGISLAGSLGIMQAQGLQIITVIIISTIIMLVVTTYVTLFFIKVKSHLAKPKAKTRKAPIFIKQQIQGGTSK